MKHQTELKLTLPQRFSFNENLRYLSRSTNECMFHIETGSIYKRIPAQPFSPLVEISGEQEGAIVIRYLDKILPQPEEINDAVTRYVRDWFDLDTDLEPFYELAGSDPLLQKVVNEFYGLRIMGIPDLFEALCWGIIGQQINLAFAYTLKRRFVEAFGEQTEYNGMKYWIFPEPHRIAERSVEDLTSLQMTTKKSEYIIGVAQLMAEGLLSKEGLLQAGGLAAVEKQLVKIRGIGPWTANYVIMRCLRMPAAFPIDDVGLHNAIKHLLGLDQKPSIAHIRQLSSSWGDWKAYATFYLWRCLY
ncbi:DNA-3-methyladenine glycosylase 2 [Paenibacillus allorhizosphaerae]|uniref:DNA-3-methyladenine glycosylase II n=1 Tax=Paenibacillus allorhizosphaerae TaxID=2849866 RepID=A0ABN7TFY0_9BACL|nr:DNA-3-methyladenine glycosylase [Paenibacillus allorhizosphaerae]CAG7627117.1 DNA-3-methyladenine glycosylase [Paenibacillus allorhizosphaerae]